MSSRRNALSVDQHVSGVLAGDRAVLARTITLIESRRADHQDKAQTVLSALLPHTGGSIRVGLTGSPGVGKSTFIEALGMNLVESGSKVAVLAVDPTSSLTGGSILGDKTRMTRLAADKRAFIRPSPSAGTLGGVTRKTRETLLLCEAAGYDAVLIETVGVGQSEFVVAGMVDFFLVLMLPGGGDELQGIKRGILELADMIAINKADGERKALATLSRQQMKAALHLMRDPNAMWHPPVLAVSALKGDGVVDVWDAIKNHRSRLDDVGELAALRQRQQVKWMWSLIEQGLMDSFKGSSGMMAELARWEAEILEGRATPVAAAQTLLSRFMGKHQ